MRFASALPFLSVLGLTTISGVTADESCKVNELVSCLSSSLSPQGSVVLPDQSLFAADVFRFSTYDLPSFQVVSQVANEHDLRVSIQCAKSAGIPFLITGPRHGFYNGFTKLKNGLEIMVSAFNQVSVDAEANTMIVGGAVTMQEVADALYAVGKNIPIGGSACVGFVGASMGAGIGRLQGLYGTMADSILSVRIMLPNTTVVEASTEQNPELFWGIRGSGFNFGYVLNATYRVYEQVPNGLNFNADFEFPASVARSFYQALSDEAHQMPAPFCIATSLGWAAAYNETTLLVNAVYAGPENEGRQAIKFLEQIGPVLRQNSTSVPWNQLAQTAFFLNGNTEVLNCDLSFGPRSVRGAAINVVDVESSVRMTEQFVEMVTKYPEMRYSDNSMYFCANQGVREVPGNTTAYPWRNAVGHQTWGIAFPTNNQTDASLDYLPEKMRATIAETAGTDGLAVYIGFSNGDEPLHSLYSKENLPRLAALKKEYDPEGLFNAYHPLPTSYPE